MKGSNNKRANYENKTTLIPTYSTQPKRGPV